MNYSVRSYMAIFAMLASVGCSAEPSGGYPTEPGNYFRYFKDGTSDMIEVAIVKPGLSDPIILLGPMQNDTGGHLLLGGCSAQLVSVNKTINKTSQTTTHIKLIGVIDLGDCALQDGMILQRLD